MRRKNYSQRGGGRITGNANSKLRLLMSTFFSPSFPHNSAPGHSAQSVDEINQTLIHAREILSLTEDENTFAVGERTKEKMWKRLLKRRIIYATEAKNDENDENSNTPSPVAVTRYNFPSPSWTRRRTVSVSAYRTRLELRLPTYR